MSLLLKILGLITSLLGLVISLIIFVKYWNYFLNYNYLGISVIFLLLLTSFGFMFDIHFRKQLSILIIIFSLTGMILVTFSLILGFINKISNLVSISLLILFVLLIVSIIVSVFNLNNNFKKD